MTYGEDYRAVVCLDLIMIDLDACAMKYQFIAIIRHRETMCISFFT